MKNMELLCPIKNSEDLYTATANGADSMYVGLETFNARWKGRNFTAEQLKEAVEYAHGCGKKIFVAVNVLIKEHEIPFVLDVVKTAVESGADALIVQDIGLAKLIAELYPEVELHASTQMTVSNKYGAEVLKKNGFSRVVLARELNYHEISEIHKQVDSIEIEVFCHGGMCSCFSGQCYASGFYYGLSGNRGMCEALCCNEYAVYNNGSFLKQGKVIKPNDLCTIDVLDKLSQSGVDALKIQGRTRKNEYIGTVVDIYAGCIKSINENRSAGLTAEIREKLKLSYNRNQSTGHVMPQPNFSVFSDEVSETQTIYKKQKGERFVISSPVTKDLPVSVALNKIIPDEDYLSALKEVSRVYIPLRLFNEKNKKILESIAFNKELFVVMPSAVCQKNIESIYKKVDLIIKQFNIKGIALSNIGDIELINRYKGMGLEFSANYTLNITNSCSAEFFGDKGVNSITLSTELSDEETERLLERTNIITERIVYGSLALMTLNYCLMAGGNGCRQCSEKMCRQSRIELVGEETSYYAETDCDLTQTVLFGQKKLSLSPYNTNVKQIRLDFLDETAAEIAYITDCVKKGKIFISKFDKNNIFVL